MIQNQEELKRIEKIKSHAVMPNEKLEYQDLLLLLKHDEELQGLIEEILNGSDKDSSENRNSIETKKTTERIVEVEKIIEVEKLVEIEVEKIVIQTIQLEDPIRDELEQQLEILGWLIQQPELMQRLNLNSNLTQGRLLLSWCACASNLDNIIMLWEFLSELCCMDKRSVTKQELACLKVTLLQHNDNYLNHKVTLLDVPEGTLFDFEIHKRVITAQGNNVEQCCLAGLYNVHGDMLCKPLVQTH